MPIADRLTKARTRVRTAVSSTWRSPAKFAEPVLPASHSVVTPLGRQKWSVCPPMSCALTKTWAWMSTRPGVTSRPLALIVRRASLRGRSGATATILPPAMPTSMRPLSPAAGSSTSPSVSSRSYFISGSSLGGRHRAPEIGDAVRSAFGRPPGQAPRTKPRRGSPVRRSAIRHYRAARSFPAPNG